MIDSKGIQMDDYNIKEVFNETKNLIEENENIFIILIDNLSNDKNTEKDIKQKIYNIIY